MTEKQLALFWILSSIALGIAIGFMAGMLFAMRLKP